MQVGSLRIRELSQDVAQNASAMEDGTSYVGLLISAALVAWFNSSACTGTEQVAALTSWLAMVEEHLRAAASIVSPRPTKKEPGSG